MKTSDQINELAAALAKAQSAIRAAERNATNPYFHSRYADLDAVWGACREPLSAHGLSVVQATETIPEPGPVTRMVNKSPVQVSNTIRVEVTTRLMHQSGQWIETVLRVLPDGDRAQDVAASAGFAKRVALASLVGVPQEAEEAEGAEPQQRQQQRRPAPPPRLGPPAKQRQDEEPPPPSEPQPESGDGPTPNAQQAIDGWLLLVDAAATLGQLDELAAQLKTQQLEKAVSGAVRAGWAKKRAALQKVQADAQRAGEAAAAA